MARGKYAHSSSGVKLPVVLIFLVIAIIAVIFAVTALVRSLHNEDPLPDPVEDVLTGQQQEQQAPPQDNTQPPVDQAALQAQRQVLLEQAELLLRGYYYDDAIALLENCGELMNTDTAALLQDVKKAKESLVKYEGGQYYHIFFHSLAADTALTFDGDREEAGYDDFMTTVSEFKAMLPLLQEACFILYDITDMVEQVDGKDNLYTAQSNFVWSLKNLAMRYNVHIMLVAHPRKTQIGEMSNDDISGSGDITNKVDTVIFYGRKSSAEDGEGHITVTKNRLTGKLAVGKNIIETQYSRSSKRIATGEKDAERTYGWEKMQKSECDENFYVISDDAECPF